MTSDEDGKSNKRPEEPDDEPADSSNAGSGDHPSLDPSSFLAAPPVLPDVPQLEKVRPPVKDIRSHPIAKWSQSGAAASITSTLVIPIALFSYLGYLLDNRLHHTTPYCALGGFILGVVGSGLGVYNILQRLK